MISPPAPNELKPQPPWEVCTTLLTWCCMEWRAGRDEAANALVSKLPEYRRGPYREAYVTIKRERQQKRETA